MLIGKAALGSMQAFVFLVTISAQLFQQRRAHFNSPEMMPTPLFFFFLYQKRTEPCPSDGCKCTALLTPDALRALLTQSFQIQEIHYVRITDLKPHLKRVQPEVLTVFKQKN